MAVSPAIIISNLSKKYSTKAFDNGAADNSLSNKEFIAVNNISLTINSGDKLGIIGNNGAGKSTFLKLLSGIVSPTEGSITINGKLASILDFGTGFHPELSGRENVLLSGSLVGMTKDEVNKRLPLIADFSELGHLINMPVKYYSTGMYIRLASAIIFHLDADILIFDEVMQAGDASFRNKSMDKMKELVATDKTIIIASHDLNSISTFCNQCIIMDHGRIAKQGTALELTQQYVEHMYLTAQRQNQKAEPIDLSDTTGYTDYSTEDNPDYKSEAGSSNYETDKEHILFENEDIAIVKASIVSSDGSSRIMMGREAKIEVKAVIKKSNTNYLTFLIRNHVDFPVMAINPILDGVQYPFNKTPGPLTITITIPGMFLNHGFYILHLHVVSADFKLVKEMDKLLFFKVHKSDTFNKQFAYDGNFDGPLMPRLPVSVTYGD